MVIGYNVDLWVKRLIGTSIIRKVMYADNLPLVMGPLVVNQENAYGFMSSKGNTWDYEQEWRQITEFSKARATESGISVIDVPQESVSSVLITDRTSEETVDTIVQRLNNPSNSYRLSRIDKLRRGDNPSTLSFVGQMKTR